MGHRGGHAGDAPHLGGQVRRHQVHVLGQALPGAGHALDLGLAAQDALGTDLAGDAGHLGGERPQLVDHRVDRVLELEDLAAGVDGDLLGEVALGDRGGHLGDVADLVGQVGGHEVHVLGEALPGARYALHLGLAAELSVGADLAGDAGDLVGERRELVDHRVDGPLELEHLALHVDGDLLAQVAVGHRGRHLGDVADLVGQVAGHEVDVVGQVLPGAGDAGHLGLAAEDPLGADLARHARHLVGEAPELVDHRVDRVLELEDLALHVDGDLLAEVAVGHGGGDLGDVADLVGQVRGHEVHRVGEVLPGAGHAGDLGLTAELAVGADLACHAGHLGGEARELVDHRVHRGADPGELALHRAALDLERHLLVQVALGDRDDHARDLGGGADQVVDQAVDRVDRGAPSAGGAVQARALGHASLAADDLGHADELGLERSVAGGHLVEGGLEPADLVLAPGRQTNAEITGGGGVHGALEAVEGTVVEDGATIAGWGGAAVSGLAHAGVGGLASGAVGGLAVRRFAVGRPARGARSSLALLPYQSSLRHALRLRCRLAPASCPRAARLDAGDRPHRLAVDARHYDDRNVG